jgi:hypothetical protein
VCPDPGRWQAALEGVHFEAGLLLLDCYTDDFLVVDEFVAFYDDLQR